MPMIDCEFTRQSREIVERFLQSAVVVDDWSFTDESSEPEPPKDFKSPPKRPAIDSAPSAEELPSTQAPEVTDENEGIQRFDAKKVIDAFANKGIVCAVLDPKQEELDSLYSTITKLAAISDVLIFDWSLVGDAGLHTREFIKNLVHNDEDNKDRLRLMVIYTIESKISDILDDVEREINKLPEAPSISKNQAEYSLHIGSTKIVILLKQDARIPPENAELISRKIPFDELVNRVIYEFTEMTCGLIPNAALQSMSEIRNNTSKILKHFNSELDAPYLTHRSLLRNPEDAEEHLVSLVAAELSAILEEKDVGATANIKAIKRWINYKKPGKDNFKARIVNGAEKEWSKEQVIELLEKGIPNLHHNNYQVSKKRFEDAHDKIKLSEMYHCSDQNQLNLDEKFAVVANIRSFYGKPIPKMNLGTIIKTHDNAKQYYICIQPRCDCVRITDERSFLFLPMTIRTDDKFDLVIQDDGNYVCFSISKSSYDLSIIEFKPKASDKGQISAHKRTGNYFFKDTKQKVYKWIGELRGEHAIDLSFKYAKELSRVGLNESEWLRRRAE